ncbi:MAG TPA: hypothetical protein VJU86_12305 [Pyrinomonadaceae bacterium]|nr:hypothetical protein [Pyrinomonadaceae bacterium]
MRKLRLLIIALATICVLALGVFALVNQISPPDPVDDIVIKGGSLEIQCGTKHGTDCLGTNDNKGKYKHKKDKFKITNIVVRDVANNNLVYFDRSFDPQKPPQIEIKFKEQLSPRSTE